MGAPSTPAATATNPIPGSSFHSNIGSQIAASTNFTFAGVPESKLGAPSTTGTNPFFANVFHSKIGSQIATTTNFTFAGVPVSKLGVPSIIETNPFFGRSFQNKIGGQIATATNFSFTNRAVGNPINRTIQQLAAPKSDEGGSNNLISGASSTPATSTNHFFGSSFQSNLGAPTATTTSPFSANAARSVVGAQTQITNFLFVSSTQSWIGQGQSLFAAPTNGYNVRLTEISPNILQFNITASNSVATNWLLEFSTTNEFFTAGAYSNAVNAAAGPTRLQFGGMGRGNNTSDGAFNVLEATYSASQIVSFAADFVQLDNNDTNSWNEGSIRFNSTIPDTANLFMAPVAISFQKGNTILTWSTNLVGFQLEYATNLRAFTWFTNNSVPAIVDGQFTITVTNGVSPGAHVYRLMKPL